MIFTEFFLVWQGVEELNFNFSTKPLSHFLKVILVNPSSSLLGFGWMPAHSATPKHLLNNSLRTKGLFELWNTDHFQSFQSFFWAIRADCTWQFEITSSYKGHRRCRIFSALQHPSLVKWRIPDSTTICQRLKPLGEGEPKPSST